MSGKSQILVMDDPAQAAHKGAALLVRALTQHPAGKEFFSLALSGGSTPRSMHRLLTSDSLRSLIPWDRLHLFWVDERCVPPEDSFSNYGAALRDFLAHAPIPPGQVHRMPAEMNPEEGALAYENEILRAFGLPRGEYPFLDLVFLGLGKDGHVASLFPGDRALEEEERLVVAVRGGEPDVNRFTLTLPVINRAREIIFLVSGRDKASMVKAVLEGRNEGLPAQRIRPLKGRTTWLLDRQAASLLDLGGA